MFRPLRLGTLLYFIQRPVTQYATVFRPINLEHFSVQTLATHTVFRPIHLAHFSVQTLITDTVFTPTNSAHFSVQTVVTQRIVFRLIHTARFFCFVQTFVTYHTTMFRRL